MAIRRSVPALLIALLALGAAAAPAGGGRPTPRCATSGLVVWLDTQGDGAAGSVFYPLPSRTSARACTLTGFPGVSAVDLRGRQLGSPAARDRTTAGRPACVGAGATAGAVVRIAARPYFPTAQCRQTMAAGLRVYPPNQTAAKIVPFPFRACSRSGPIFLQVRAVRLDPARTALGSTTSCSSASPSAGPRGPATARSTGTCARLPRYGSYAPVPDDTMPGAQPWLTAPA